MWELTIVLDENEDCYFEYVFGRYLTMTNFIMDNEMYNSDHCKYHIEKVSKED